MSFQIIDWFFFTGLLVALVFVSFYFQRFAKSVAGFLVVGRKRRPIFWAGIRFNGRSRHNNDSRHLSDDIWVRLIGNFWYLLKPLAATLVALTSFGIYRFRQARAMTLGQFVEKRYSKRIWILFGLIAYAVGVLNMGVFPCVGLRFFVYYCGFPVI
jgi:SSS family solute:Na+ symporter